MNKIFALVASLLMAFSVQATTFTEGDYYTVIDQPKASKPTVTEYFSFYCPHCYQFESIVKNLKPALADDVTFEKVHVGFMGGEMAEPMVKAYATMQQLQVEDHMIPKMFEQIHILRQAPRNEEELRKVFTDNGVSASAFDLAYNSKAVEMRLKEYDKRFKNSTLRGVPAIVVNNKYIVVASKIKSFDEYNQLVNYLLTL
ncbi:thiol:disulfide interchange protein DsbA/DsbL [Vibrio panuliri]|uniref:Thiol:disulfide interchange protein n=1 Tax=Vibrio panuliri TaxID=1381081 RepID=A0ABX3FLE6_9VIBR|nr:thiol:disulfide interchange protein DsbA/DsbL [Vibrio panuliri]KAB1454138.1 thiol:disulfide interchange protein DsbA/DsbL [Vibrio panuliri]OLQ93647.1 thiol:disulfide interchange protein [Vibrio panuliri]